MNYYSSGFGILQRLRLKYPTLTVLGFVRLKIALEYCWLNVL